MVNIDYCETMKIVVPDKNREASVVVNASATSPKKHVITLQLYLTNEKILTYTCQRMDMSHIR
jgi:hypothetical protein